MTDIDAQAHFDALKAAIVAVFGEHVYEYGTVPGLEGNEGTTPPSYVLLTVVRRFGPILKGSARAPVSGWRASARGVGRWLPDNARTALQGASDALNEQRLTVDGVLTTPLQFEAAQVVRPDGPEHFSGLDSYTYGF